MNPSIPAQIARNRRYIRARLKPRIGILGQADGTLYHPDRGYYWARWRGSKDANGNASQGQPFPVWAGESNYLPHSGRMVYIGTGLNGRLTILGAVPDDLVNAGFDARAHNPNDPYRQFVYLNNAVIHRSDALADEGNDTLKVNLNQLFYRDSYGQFIRWNGTDENTHLDLADYATVVTDEHQYALVTLRTLENLPAVYVSTPKSAFLDLDFTDIQECISKADPECIDSRVWRIAGDQTTLVANPVTDLDMRQWINMPPRLGNPTVITERLRVRANHQLIYYGEVQVLGELHVLGEVVLLGIDEGSGTDTGITQLTGDVTAGPGSGSQAATLANTAVTPGSYTYTALTVDAKGRLTAASNGVPPMIDFDIDADSGTAATIADGDLVQVLGDAVTIETSIAAKIITVSLKAEARLKVCDFRISKTAVGPYGYISAATVLDFVPLNSATLALPVSGVWHYFDAGDVTEQIDYAHVETGNVTSGTSTILGMSSVEQLAVGMKISGTGINAAATIVSIDSATQITMTHSASATNSGVTLTFTFPDAVNYDVFLKRVSGVVIPKYSKWSSNTNRGYTPTVLDGIPVKDTDNDMRLIGSIRATATGFERQETMCLISNLYHPFPHRMQVIDTTDSWNYTSTSFRRARGSAANKLEVLSTAEYYIGSFHLKMYSLNTSGFMFCAIGLNNSATYGIGGVAPSTFPQLGAFDLDVEFGLGYTTIDWLEKGNTGGVFYGDNGGIGLQSGLTGLVMA